MELLWTALVLGLAGSVHCAAMCGPLILLVAKARVSPCSPVRSSFAYHTGRLSIYVVIGIVFGALGHSLALAGWQRGLSITAGVLILGGLFLSSPRALKTPIVKLVTRLKSTFGDLLQRRSLASQFGLGAINGLLPCGLVYVAAAGAAATGHPLAGAGYMAVFGLGTLPMLVGIVLAGERLPFAARLHQLLPVSVAVVAVLLILRGLALGIPYLSPAAMHSCH
jgi:sulfite exporter TauE/SafE